MKLADWLEEYRSLPVDKVTRPTAEPDDWEEPDLLAPLDRRRDTSPRWLERAARIGHGRATQL